MTAMTHPLSSRREAAQLRRSGDAARLVQATLRRFTSSRRALAADDARTLLGITQVALAALERVVMVRTDRTYDSFNDPEPDDPEEIAEVALKRCALLANPARRSAKTRRARSSEST